MRKSIIADPGSHPGSAPLGDWLDLGRLASVEVTSEDPAFPIEHALDASGTFGWRASTPGPQSIRLLFDSPQHLRRIQLHIVEPAAERSQELAVFASCGTQRREVVRQQWNFSPTGTTEEFEDYTVDLNDVSSIELRIDPDRSHNPALSHAYASLQRLRLA